MFVRFKLVVSALYLVQLGQAAVIDLESRQTGKNLRILPLGDSITFGSGSSDGNSYRSALRTTLINKTNTIDLVGSVKSGTMVDNDHEGHGGFTIDQIRTDAGFLNSIATQPSVVLLHIGTNDVNRNLDVGNAPTRLGTLIDRIFQSAPDTTLLVAQIIRANNVDVQTRVTNYNNAIPAIVATRRNAGKKIAVVNFGSALASTDLVDTLHPNAGGYVKMANVWATGLQTAANAGWI